MTLGSKATFFANIRFCKKSGVLKLTQGGNTMPSNKLARTNDDIQIVLSKLLRDVKDPRVQQGMISITRVETTGDLRYSKVWLSVLGMQDEKEFKKGLKSASGWLRKELGSSMSLRYTPELVFEIDHSIEYGAHINDLINKLDIKHDDEE
jgi:ribosome-binding factor A